MEEVGSKAPEGMMGASREFPEGRMGPIGLKGRHRLRFGLGREIQSLLAAWNEARVYLLLVLAMGGLFAGYRLDLRIESLAAARHEIILSLGLVGLWTVYAWGYSRVSGRALGNSLKTGCVTLTPLLLFPLLTVVHRVQPALWAIVITLSTYWIFAAILLLKLILEDYWLARLGGLFTRTKTNPHALILGMLVAAYVLGLSYLSLEKYWSYRDASIDHAVFTQVVWNSLHGRLMMSSLPEGNYLGYHVSISLLLLVPFYALYPHPETLLVVQSLTLAAGALPVFLLAKEVLRHRTVALAFSGLYLVYPATVAMNLFAFHPETAAIPLFLVALWALAKDRFWLVLMALIFAFSTKEDNALMGIFLGLYVTLYARRWRMGLAITAVSLSWFLLSVIVVIPHFLGGPPYYLQERFGYLGPTPAQMVASLFTRPDLVLPKLLRLQNAEYTFDLLIPAFLLPLANLSPRRWTAGFSPNLILVMVPILMINMLADYPYMSIIGYQYTAPLIPFIFASSIYGLARLFDARGWGMASPAFAFALRSGPSKVGRGQATLAVAMVLLLFSYPVTAVLSPLPISERYEPQNFTLGSDARAVARIVAIVPPDSSITVTRFSREAETAVDHLANREKLYTYPDHWNETDFLLIDMRTLRPGQIERIEALASSGQYHLVAEEATFRLYARNG